jgi:hypothetical protein
MWAYWIGDAWLNSFDAVTLFADSRSFENSRVRDYRLKRGMFYRNHRQPTILSVFVDTQRASKQ